MKIDRKLNLVIPVEADGVTRYIHSSPIHREIFQRYFFVISKTFSQIFSPGGLGPVAGPRVAAMALKKVAEDMGVWDGDEGVELGLMREIRRLTNVLCPTDAGWEAIPLEDAIKKNLFDQEDGDEIENALVFFTLGSLMFHRREREVMLTGALTVWNAQVSSQSIMELEASLRTSTATDSSGEKAKA